MLSKILFGILMISLTFVSRAVTQNADDCGCSTALRYDIYKGKRVTLTSYCSRERSIGIILGK